MRNALIVALLAAGAAVASIPVLAEQRRESGNTIDSGGAMAAQEVIDREIRLEPGAEVSVEGIAGPVTVETGDGDSARIHIVRTARTERELACYRTEISGGGARLAIAHNQFVDQDGCNSIRAHQEVRLTLPRTVNLRLETIAGDVDLAAIEGALTLESIAGHVRARGARSANLSSLADGLELTVGALDQGGIDISSVAGPARIDFAPGANAEVSVSSVQGEVRASKHSLSLRNAGGPFTMTIGDGGAPVSISSVAGDVELNGS